MNLRIYQKPERFLIISYFTDFNINHLINASRVLKDADQKLILTFDRQLSVPALAQYVERTT